MKLLKCSSCKLRKINTEFKRNRSVTRGYGYQCKTCVREYRSLPSVMKRSNDKKRENYQKPEVKASYRKMGDRYRSMPGHKDRMKDYYLKKIYGLSLQKYNEMFLSQNRCCALCGIDQSILEKALAVDHDHETGEVRSLLCHYCNTAIGSFREDIGLMKKAMSYIEDFKKKKMNVIRIEGI